MATILLVGMSGAGKKSIMLNHVLQLQNTKTVNKKLKTPEKSTRNFAITTAKYNQFDIVSFDIDDKDTPVIQEGPYFWGRKAVNYYDALIFVVDAKDRVKLGNINMYILFSGWIRTEFEQVTGRMVCDDVIDVCFDYFNPDLCPIIGTYYTAFNILESLDFGEKVCCSMLKYSAPILVLGNKSEVAGHMEKEELIKKLNMKAFQRNWLVLPCSAKTGDGLQFGFQWIAQKLSLETK